MSSQRRAAHLGGVEVRKLWQAHRDTLFIAVIVHPRGNQEGICAEFATRAEARAYGDAKIEERLAAVRAKPAARELETV
jgi:hypothetical protein